MFRFSEWFAIDSIFESIKHEDTVNRAILESIDLIVSHINESQEDESGDAPDEGDDDAEPIFDRTRGPSVVRRLKAIALAIKVIKNESIKQRAAKIERLAEKKKEIEEDSLDSPDITEVVDDLVDLGYLSSKEAGEKIKQRMASRHEYYDEEDPTQKKLKKAADKDSGEAEKELRELLSKAAAETGNDPMHSLQGDMDQAKRVLHKNLSEVFGDRFDSVAARNQRHTGEGIGHQTYEADDIANSLFIYLLDRFSKRPKKKGEFLPWDSRADEFLVPDAENSENPYEHLLAYIHKAITHTASKQRRKKAAAFNPSSRPRGRGKRLHSSKDERSKIIRADLASDNLGFYKNYIGEAKKRPFSVRKEDEDIVKTPAKDDDTRLAIMKDIEYEVHNHPSSSELLSMDPSQIEATLSSYMQNFLKRREGSVTYASSLGGRDSDSSVDDMLSRNMSHVQGSEDESDSSDSGFRGIAGGGEDSSAPTSAPNMSLLSDFFMPYVVRAVKELAVSNAQHTLALCIKFGISCMIKAKTKSIRGVSSIVPETITITEPDTINPQIDENFKKYLKQMLSDETKQTWAHWDHSGAKDSKGRSTFILPENSFCRMIFDKLAVVSGVSNNTAISLIWSEIPETSQGVYRFNPRDFSANGTPNFVVDPNKPKLYPYNQSRVQEVLLGTAMNSGAISWLCNRVFEMIKF